MENCKISTQLDQTQPNPQADPTHGQLWSLNYARALVTEC